MFVFPAQTLDLNWFAACQTMAVERYNDMDDELNDEQWDWLCDRMWKWQDHPHASWPEICEMVEAEQKKEMKRKNTDVEEDKSHKKIKTRPRWKRGTLRVVSGADAIIDDNIVDDSDDSGF